MDDTNTEARKTAFEAALEEAMAMMEQGQEMNRARFDELIASLGAEADLAKTEAVEDDDSDERRAMVGKLLARANDLEKSSHLGQGQMDELNSLLSPLMGKKSS